MGKYILDSLVGVAVIAVLIVIMKFLVPDLWVEAMVCALGGIYFGGREQ